MGVVGKHYDDHKNLLKRQVAASEYIRLLKSGREIINVDESIIRSTDQRTRGWVRKGKRVFTSNALRLPQISMIGAISSKGKTFFAINQGKNNSLNFSVELDSLDPDWRARPPPSCSTMRKFIVRKPQRHTSRRSDCRSCSLRRTPSR